jgi:hypothetical protein
MMHRASLLMLLTGCGAASPPPRTLEPQPARETTREMTEEEALPEPSLFDTMREQIICNGRCPPLVLERQPPSGFSGFEILMWRCGRRFDVRITSLGTVLRERRGEALVIDHIKPADAEALARSVESVAKPVEMHEGQRSGCAGPGDSVFKHSVDYRPNEFIRLERLGGDVSVVGPKCSRSRDAGAFPLADEIDRVAHVID